MATFEQIKKQVAKASQDALDKTKELASVAKLNLMIQNEKRIIARAYMHIGRAYVAEFSDAEEKLLPEEFDMINLAKQNIAECNKAVMKIKGLKSCNECGAQMPVSAKFCPSCGAHAEVSEEDVAEDTALTRVCQNCGAALSDEQTFCMECGTKADI